MFPKVVPKVMVKMNAVEYEHLINVSTRNNIKYLWHSKISTACFIGFIGIGIMASLSIAKRNQKKLVI